MDELKRYANVRLKTLGNKKFLDELKNKQTEYTTTQILAECKLHNTCSDNGNCPFINICHNLACEWDFNVVEKRMQETIKWRKKNHKKVRHLYNK